MRHAILALFTAVITACSGDPPNTPASTSSTPAPASTTTPAATPAPAPQLTEAQKIEKLIESVGALQGATFIRNGDEHSAADAATHLRRKRDAGGKDVATAEQFIENAATRSSLSGKDYEIRFADGRTVRLADFLKEQLAKLSAS